MFDYKGFNLKLGNTISWMDSFYCLIIEHNKSENVIYYSLLGLANFEVGYFLVSNKIITSYTNFCLQFCFRDDPVKLLT